VRQYLVELEEQNPVEEPVREQGQIVGVQATATLKRLVR
jgi:hypothetical protein